MICDRCGGMTRARWVIWARNGGVLYMCNHHYDQHAAALLAGGYRVSDMDKTEANKQTLGVHGGF